MGSRKDERLYYLILTFFFGCVFAWMSAVMALIAMQAASEGSFGFALGSLFVAFLLGVPAYFLWRFWKLQKT